jgi:hypothetical protein
MLFSPEFETMSTFLLQKNDVSLHRNLINDKTIDITFRYNILSKLLEIYDCNIILIRQIKSIPIDSCVCVVHPKLFIQYD